MKTVRIPTVAAVAVTLAAAGAPPAHAAGGTYTQVICADPVTGQGVGGGLPEEMSSYYTDYAFSAAPSLSDCSGQMNGTKGIVLTNGPSRAYSDGAYGALAYDAPAGVALVSGVLYRAFHAPSSASHFIVSQQGAGPSAEFGAPWTERYDWYRGTLLDAGTRYDAFAASNAIGVAVGDRAHWYAGAYCDSNGGGGCWLDGGTLEYRIFGGRLTLEDDASPEFSGSPSGSLAGAGPLAGPAEVSFSASDSGAGLYRVRLLVDGTLAAVQPVDPGSSRCADLNPANADPYEFASARPCRLSAAGTYAFPTAAIAEGAHNFKVVIEDAGGNAATIVNRELTVDNVPAPASLDAPSISGRAVDGSELSADPGSWSGAIGDYAYAWRRCDASGDHCAAVPDATAPAYRLVAADVGHRFLVQVSARNAAGETVSVLSGATPVVEALGGPTLRMPVLGGGDTAGAGAGLTAIAGRGQPNGENASDHARLVARFATAATSRRIRYGRPVTVGGKLLDEDGRAIGGAALIVTATTRRPGAEAVPVATVLTGPDGSFSYRAPAGPSRTLTFSYRAYSADRDFAATRTVSLLVRSAASLRALPARLHNGHTVTFSGRLLGGNVPAAGVLVDLQVRYDGAWHSFQVTRSRRDGTYRARYTFRRTVTRVVYRFRARLRQDSAYPFLASASRTVAVTVSP